MDLGNLTHIRKFIESLTVGERGVKLVLFIFFLFIRHSARKYEEHYVLVVVAAAVIPNSKCMCRMGNTYLIGFILYLN